MSGTIQNNPEKSTSDALEEILAQLTPNQIRFVVARQDTTTDKEAAELVGIKPDTVSHWKSRDGAPICAAVQLSALDSETTARHIRKRNLAKAMSVKVAGLDSDDERTRQSASTEIIEWEMGRAQQGIKHSGTGEDGEVVIRVVYGDDGTYDTTP